MYNVYIHDAYIKFLILCIAIQNASNKGQKRKIEETTVDNNSDDESHDEVRLWEDGFKDRYYESKFGVSSDNLAFR